MRYYVSVATDFDDADYLRRGIDLALSCDYDDGGFRGWGTVIPVKQGTRTRYYWLTFDRHKGSDYNWSYGNLYCFEGYDF